MDNNSIRFGIVGIGWWSYITHVPNLRATGKAEVVAISRRNGKALREAKEGLGVEHAFSDWHEMLEQTELDAVVVSTAHHVHTEPVLAGLERGLDVLVEKPMTLKGAEARAMVEKAGETGRLLAVAYNRRSSGLWRCVKRELEEGAIGIVRQVNVAFCYNQRFFWDAEALTPGVKGMMERLKQSVPPSFIPDELGGYWRGDSEQMGGGGFVDMGSHMVDLALWLGGGAPQRVVALTENAGLPVDCHVVAQGQLDNGVLVSLSSADGVRNGAGNVVTVFGDEGRLVVEGEEARISGDGEPRVLQVDLEDSNPALEFVNGLTEGEMHLASGREGADAVAFTEAAYASAVEGRVVAVE